MKSFIIATTLLFLFLFIPSKLFAADDFTTNYKVDYYLDENNGHPLTKVKMQVDILNHTAGSYISKFSLSFPKVFKIDNATALNNVPITPVVQTEGETTTIQVTLPPPTTPDKSKSTIYFDFYQENLFQINGNVWEVILPTILLQKQSSYEISLHLPDNTNKHLSISKPTPTTIEGNVITWTNPDVKTIYTTFGSQQYYALNLVYHLQNKGIGRVYTDVAFPPDSLYQKMYLGSIDPPPATVFEDEDGNYIGRYYLNPKESKTITYKGTAELDSLPRAEVKTYQSNVLDSQKKYLLNKNKYWDVNVKTDLHTASDIFSYVTSALQYDLADINKDKKRLGADQALREPTKAVCTEFTDVFVALARQKGIYSREVEGYGYSSDLELRPVSVNSDILHAWPEYYDQITQQWTPVDPTWQSTSGINYFSSLDLNHIIFAIHGKDPEYPFPAGTYKIGDSKDVSIQPVANKPTESTNVVLSSNSIPKKVFGNKVYTSTLTFENKGNIYVWELPVKITSNIGLQKNITIGVLAPMEKKQVKVAFKTPNVLKLQQGELEMKAQGSSLYSSTYQLMPYYYDIALKVGIIITSLATIFLLIKVFKKDKKVPNTV
jgi:hypothetical protein